MDYFFDDWDFAAWLVVLMENDKPIEKLNVLMQQKFLDEVDFFQRSKEKLST